jgi:hypothetical protein
MEKKQTAVELFALDLYEKGLLKGNGDEIQESLERHKKIEKEQIEMGWDNGEIDHSYGKMYKNFEDYYNANYGETKN